ncbi:MAG: HD domain-containing protein [Deltaproteobacteria bacterium]|nr:HD domain-containing protein [Deltaproteobacteria bacterium]
MEAGSVNTNGTGAGGVEYPEILRTVFDAFGERSVQAYLIGPRARDLAGSHPILESSSFDLTVDTSLADVESAFWDLFQVAPQEAKEDRPKLLTFKVPRPAGTITFNVGPFRNYLPPLRSLRGQNLSGIILDLATREVTIQAFGYDPHGNLVDPFGGTADLAEKLVRPVFPVDTIFRESASWLLKVARYVARYGFEPAREVRQAAERDAPSVLDVPRDIWHKEMEKILCGAHPSRGLQFMADTRVLSFMLPEVAALIAFSETAGGQHKDIWQHTKQVVQNADASPVVRWAALCHDIGKVWTRQVLHDKVHFFRHEDMSALLFEGIAMRFQVPSDQSARVHYIIKNHSRINLYREDWTDSAVRRLIKEVGEFLDDLIAFSRADLTSKRVERIEMVRSLLTDLQIRILEIREADAQVSPLPKDIGNAIMARFGIQPGPEVGRLKQRLLAAIEGGELAGGQDVDAYLSWLADRLPGSGEEP